MVDPRRHPTEAGTAPARKVRTRQFVALSIGVAAVLLHGAAWGVITIANAVADSISATLFIPLALIAIFLVTAGIGLGVTAPIVALRALPIDTGPACDRFRPGGCHHRRDDIRDYL